MTYIVLIVFSAIFVFLMSAYLFVPDSDEKDTKRMAALLMILIIVVYGVSLYGDIKTSRTYYYDFIEEYAAAKTIIETEIQNKTIFSSNEQMLDKAINYNIELATYQARAQRKNIINIVPKEIMDLEPIQIRDGYDIKWVVG